MEMNPLRCCGVKELNLLSSYDSAKAAFKAWANLTYLRTGYILGADGVARTGPDPYTKFRYVLFSQANIPTYAETFSRKKYGEKFARLITDNHLGTVLETTSNINPNSINSLKVWLWTVDHEACAAYAKKLTVEKTSVEVK